MYTGIYVIRANASVIMCDSADEEQGLNTIRPYPKYWDSRLIDRGIQAVIDMLPRQLDIFRFRRRSNGLKQTEK